MESTCYLLFLAVEDIVICGDVNIESAAFVLVDVSLHLEVKLIALLLGEVFILRVCFCVYISIFSN